MLYLFFQNLESEFILDQPSLAPQGAHFGQKRSDWTEQFKESLGGGVQVERHAVPW